MLFLILETDANHSNLGKESDVWQKKLNFGTLAIGREDQAIYMFIQLIPAIQAPDVS
jgi:hypothetical protein